MAETHTYKKNDNCLDDVIKQAKTQHGKIKPRSCSSSVADLETEPASSKCQLRLIHWSSLIYCPCCKMTFKLTCFTAVCAAAPGMPCPRRVAVPAPLCPIARASDVSSRLPDSSAQHEAIGKSMPKMPRRQGRSQFNCVSASLMYQLQNAGKFC